LAADSGAGKTAQSLTVYTSPKNAQLKDVLIFIHGGNWNSGNKSLYGFFGKRFAAKDIVTVIPDYPKSPGANADLMALDMAKSVKWVYENIASYGGNPDRIFISGHSAGGHLAALVGIQNNYFKRLGILNPIKGIILIDAAGLHMSDYLDKAHLRPGKSHIKTFTNDPAFWKAVTPLYQLHDSMPPMLIYVGGNTFPFIKEGTAKFVTALKKYSPATGYYTVEGKSHFPMMFQFYNKKNGRYNEMIGFMKAQK
jgi:acetyl esterase/lipase